MATMTKMQPKMTAIRLLPGNPPTASQAREDYRTSASGLARGFSDLGKIYRFAVAKVTVMRIEAFEGLSKTPNSSWKVPSFLQLVSLAYVAAIFLVTFQLAGGWG